MVGDFIAASSKSNPQDSGETVSDSSKQFLSFYDLAKNPQYQMDPKKKANKTNIKKKAVACTNMMSKFLGKSVAKPPLETPVIVIPSESPIIPKVNESVIDQQYSSDSESMDAGGNEDDEFFDGPTEKETRKLRTIFQSMQKQPWAYPFLVPVDPILHECPDYFDVIQKPMDLSTISKLVLTPTEFAEHVLLMLGNCCRYNPSTDEIYQDALGMATWFQGKFGSQFPDINLDFAKYSIKLEEYRPKKRSVKSGDDKPRKKSKAKKSINVNLDDIYLADEKIKAYPTTLKELLRRQRNTVKVEPQELKKLRGKQILLSESVLEQYSVQGNMIEKGLDAGKMDGYSNQCSVKEFLTRNVEQPTRPVKIVGENKIHPFFQSLSVRKAQQLDEGRAKLREDIEEMKRVSQVFSNGRPINPFFNPKVFQAAAAIAFAKPCTPIEAPLPPPELSHINWIWNDLLPTLNAPWPTLKTNFDVRRSNGQFYYPTSKDMPNLKPAVKYYDFDKVMKRIEDSYRSKSRNELMDNILCTLKGLQGTGGTLEWSDYFRQEYVTDLIGRCNFGAFKTICQWLQNWKSLPPPVKKRNGADWQWVDYDQTYNDYCLCIQGPTGSGKTSIINHCANILGIDVIQLNTDQKRGGKEIINILREASSSYSISKDTTQIKPALIFLDDVDVLFEEDKGFWGAVGNLIGSSKCPVVLSYKDNPFNECNPNMVGLQNFLDLCFVVQTKIPDQRQMQIAIQFFGLMNGVWFEKSILKSYQKDFRDAILQAQLECYLAPRKKRKWIRLKNQIEDKQVPVTLENIIKASEFDLISRKAIIEPEFDPDELQIQTPILNLTKSCSTLFDARDFHLNFSHDIKRSPKTHFYPLQNAASTFTHGRLTRMDCISWISIISRLDKGVLSEKRKTKNSMLYHLDISDEQRKILQAK